MKINELLWPINVDNIEDGVYNDPPTYSEVIHDLRLAA